MTVWKKGLAGMLALAMMLLSLPLGVVGLGVEDPEAALREMVASVEVQPIQLIEGVNIYEDSYYDWTKWTMVSYNCYVYSPYMVVTLKDGTVLEGNESVEYDGNWYALEYEDDQRTNTWGLGVHEVTGSFVGIDVSFTVEIVTSPVASVEVQPIKIIEGAHLLRSLEYDEEAEQWVPGAATYDYSPYMTVTLLDGTECEGYAAGGFEYGGQSYYLNYEDDQSKDNVWGVGVHEVTGSFMDKDVTFTVEIVESPVESIEVLPVRLIEGITYEATDYDPETDEWATYERYTYSPEMRVTLKGGEVLEADMVEMYGEMYSFEGTDDQSAKAPWGLGSHEVTGSFMGKEVTFTVEIVESPVASIELLPVSISEDAAEEMEEYDYETGEVYTYSRYFYSVNIVVTLKDGTVLKGVNEIVYQGGIYGLTCDDGQSYQSPWGVGKYTVTGTIMNEEVTFTVEVVASTAVRGDVNGDGKVTVADYGLALAHVRGTKILVDEKFQAADVNDDGKVSVADYGLILAHVRGTKPLF